MLEASSRRLYVLFWGFLTSFEMLLVLETMLKPDYYLM